MELVIATDEDKRQRDHLGHSAWGGKLSIDQWVLRDERLRAHAWARRAMTTWLRSLRQQAAPPPAVRVVRPATGSLAIVVRPSMEGDQREAAAARSLTSELVTALSAVPGYRIASQATGAVDFLVDGTVQRQGKVLRVNLRFVDARRDSTMWALARQGALDAVGAALRGAMR